MSTAILEAEVRESRKAGAVGGVGDGVVARLWDEAVRSVSAERVPPARAPERHPGPMPTRVENAYD